MARPTLEDAAYEELSRPEEEPALFLPRAGQAAADETWYSAETKVSAKKVTPANLTKGFGISVD